MQSTTMALGQGASRYSRGEEASSYTRGEEASE